jgi:hypothetical protein
MIETPLRAVESGHPGGRGDHDRLTEKSTATNSDLVVLVGLSAVIFPVVYFVADLIEVAQGNFSTGRLVLAYIGESAIPLFVVGLYAVQRPRIGRLGYGAFAYAYSFVFFTSTVVYALAAGSKNWTAVTDAFGGWLTVHGVVMVVGGIAFGLAVIKTATLPRWTGICLIIGVLLVAAAAGMSNAVRTGAAALPDAAFIGMGVAVLRAQQRISRAGQPRPAAASRSGRKTPGPRFGSKSGVRTS